MVGNARRQPRQRWHSRQRGIRNLHILKVAGAFESHPHRQIKRLLINILRRWMCTIVIGSQGFRVQAGAC